MEPSKAGLTEIGGRIREALVDESADAAELRLARNRLLERVASDNARRARLAWPVLGKYRGLALSLGVAIAGVAGVWFYGQRAISFEVGAESTDGRLGEVVVATGNPVELRFSDGSSIVVRRGGRLRVLSAESTGAHVLIESGGMDMSIQHAEGKDTSWSFDAGSFNVRVTGTKFHTAFDPRAQTLSLAMGEGSVVVSGPCVGGSRAVSAGTSADFTCNDAGVASAASGASGPLSDGAAAPPGSLEHAPKPARAPRAHAGAPSGAGARRPVSELAAEAPEAPSGWRELLAAGSRAQALRAAESAGFAEVCRSATLKELVALADAARLEGRTALALETLGVLRQRFAGSAEAATAAFTLGRIASEQRGAPADAVRWFQTYLEESPNGPRKGDAVGRLMEAKERAGDQAGARADAARYLQRFPDGPYAPQARRILAR